MNKPKKKRKDWKDLAIKIARIASTQRVKEWWETSWKWYLTWPMAKRLKIFGITHLVGKISRSNFFFEGPGRLSEVLEDVMSVEILILYLNHTWKTIPLEQCQDNVKYECVFQLYKSTPLAVD